MRRHLRVWLLLAALSLLVAKRESVADGLLNTALPTLTAAGHPRPEAHAAFGV